MWLSAFIVAGIVARTPFSFVFILSVILSISLSLVVWSFLSRRELFPLFTLRWNAERIAEFIVVCSVGLIISGLVSMEFYRSSVEGEMIGTRLEPVGKSMTPSSELIDSIHRRVTDVFTSWVVAAREKLQGNIYDGRLNYKARVLLSSLLLGERGNVPANIREVYQYIGIAHMLAQSGLHLGIIAVPLVWVMRFLPVGDGLNSIVVLAILFGYIAIAYFPPSLVRAYVLFIVFAAKRCLGLECSLFRCLMLSGVAVLFVDPTTITKAGYQLSFLAVFGIATIGIPAIRTIESVMPGGFAGKVMRWFLYSAVITVSVQLVTVPLLLHLFRRVSGLSVLTNMVFIPPLTLFLYAGAAYTIIHVAPLPVLLSPIINLLASILWDIPRILAVRPSLGLLVTDISVVPYMLFLCCLILSFHLRGMRRVALTMVTLAFLCSSFLTGKGGVHGSFNSNSVERITFCKSRYVSYGGKSILVVGELKNFYRVRRLVLELWNKGIRGVDAIVFEKASGASYAGYLLSRIDTERFICTPYLVSGSPHIRSMVERSGCRLYECRKGDEIDIGGISVVVTDPVYPPPPGTAFREGMAVLRFILVKTDDAPY